MTGGIANEYKMKILLSGREEGAPSPMGYGRRGPAASGAWRNGNGGLGATPGSQRYVQPTVKDKHGVNFSCGNIEIQYWAVFQPNT